MELHYRKGKNYSLDHSAVQDSVDSDDAEDFERIEDLDVRNADDSNGEVQVAQSVRAELDLDL